MSMSIIKQNSYRPFGTPPSKREARKAPFPRLGSLSEGAVERSETEGVKGLPQNSPCFDETKAKRKRDKVLRRICFLKLFADKVAHDPLIIIPEPATEEGHAPAVHGVFGNKDAEADLVARL